MSLINKFDGNMNIIGSNVKKYRISKNISYNSYLIDVAVNINNKYPLF